MRLQRFITQFIALSLAILVFVGTSPVSAAETATLANIGSVSAVGSVQLRGVGISEGTLFSGDRLNVAPGAYAKVVLGAGPKVEVGGNSEVTVSKETDAIDIQMMSGNIAFSGNGQKPVRVRVGLFEISAAGQSRGTVAFVGSGTIGVRALDGIVSVRNTATKQSFTVAKGSTRLVSLGPSDQSGALLASTAPTSIPAAPAMPARQSGGLKTALIVGAVLGSAAAIAVLMTKNDDSDSEAANRLNKTQALSNASAIATTAAEAAQVAGAVSQSATSTLAVINSNTAIAANPSSKASLTASANALIAKANTAASTLASLQSQISTLEAQIAASSSVTSAQQAQLNSLYAQVEVQRQLVNSLINELNALISATNAAAGATVVTNPGLKPVAPPDVASPSNPQ